MPVAMIVTLALAVLVGIAYCKYKGWNNGLTDEDTEMIAFLKNKYIPSIESYRLQGIITEEQYKAELEYIEQNVRRMEEKA